MKLRQVNAYPIKDVPDHLVHEVMKLGESFLKALEPLMDCEAPHKTLGAINFVLAAFTKAAVSDDIEEQRKAAIVQAKGIIGNIAWLNQISLDEFMKGME